MQAAVMKLLDEVGGVGRRRPDRASRGDRRHDGRRRRLLQLHDRPAAPDHRPGAGGLAPGEHGARRSARSDRQARPPATEDQAAQAVEAPSPSRKWPPRFSTSRRTPLFGDRRRAGARQRRTGRARRDTNNIEGMGRIRDQVQETAKRIKRLGESSQEIGEIVKLIDDIADRTSILALNASIQAAMAGEAGRGFAIVADEVERLADRATEATKRAGIADQERPIGNRRSHGRDGRHDSRSGQPLEHRERSRRRAVGDSVGVEPAGRAASRPFRMRRSSRRAARSRWRSR